MPRPKSIKQFDDEIRGLTPKPRKARVKAQNAKRKGRPAPRPELSPEEFERAMTGFIMMAEGLLHILGVDPAELIDDMQTAAEVKSWEIPEQKGE